MIHYLRNNVDVNYFNLTICNLHTYIATQFITAYYKWIKDLIAVFNLMAPTTQDFGNSLQAIGNLKPKSKNFIVKMKDVNSLYQTTARRMKYLCELFSDYFSRYNNVLVNLIQ